MAWGKAHTDELLTAHEAFEKLTLDDLRPLGALIATAPSQRKSDLVPLLAGVMSKPTQVRQLYERLDALSQRAVRAAAFDPVGRLDQQKFRASFGEVPRFNTADPNKTSWTYAEQRHIKPTLLRLFFPRVDHLPTDTRELLRKFVPPPEAFVIPTRDALPETYTLREHIYYGDETKAKELEEPVRVRETALAAEADLHAVLRLIETGKVRVTDKKLVPTEATRQAITIVLSGGDFFGKEDASEWKVDPAFDIGIRSFAWPMLVQAGGLAEKRGDALKLTAAGKRALTTSPSEVLRKLWTSG